jgi:uncharacterized membrane protein YbaN (DUF454 family)
MKVLTMQLNSITVMDLIAYGGAALGVILATTQFRSGHVDLAGCILIILLLAALCFARSSEKLDRWFRNTRLYKDNLEDFVAGRGMTMKAKVRIMVTVTLLMSVGFIMMGLKGIVTGCIVLGCVWVFHIIYFVFGIKTISAAEVVSA